MFKLHLKIKTFSSFISSLIMILLIIILGIIILNDYFISSSLKTFKDYDAYLINKFGQIRGNIQRYTKYRIYGRNSKIVIKEINATFKICNHYLKEYPSIIPNNYILDFYDKYNSLQSDWKELLHTKNKQELFALSEKAWNDANEVTCMMTDISMMKIRKIDNLLIFITTISSIIIVTLILIVYRMIRTGLEKATITDPLTGLYNRLYFENQINYLQEKYKRTNTPFGVFLFDIDNFKKINDTYGHQTGDEVLKKLAKIIKQKTRKTDIACRYGGEEFIIIFPDTKLDKIRKIAERIREAIENEIQVGEKPVTISGGVGEYQGGPIHIFLSEVDKALYRAKENGKNRIYFI
jgi:diguanylate cyclase (GGDEF)-like protein